MADHGNFSEELFELFIRLVCGQRRIIRPGNLNAGDMLFLAALERAESETGEPGVTMGNLADIRAISRPAVTQAVDRLCARGLVNKRAGTDRRSVVVEMTESGKELVEGERQRILESFDRVSLSVSEKDLEEFIRIGNLIADGFNILSETGDKAC